MEEITIPALLASYLNESECGVTFVPEAWREGKGTLWLTGGVTDVREYVNGSVMRSVPFEVRIRCESDTVKKRLDVITVFAVLDEYIRSTPVPISENEVGEVKPSGGAAKSAIYENGDEEYRAAFLFRYLKKA